MATAELQSSLAQFVTFARSLKGDEKSEAQLFLDHFFRALGHGGVQEAGATLEFRIAKKPGSAQLELIKGEGAKAKGGKKFADLLWPERVLIEMKSRGANLEKHYDQAFEYWTHIVPRRPPFVILCNFDEFWIYDFNTQLFDPVEKVLLRDLPQSGAALNFLLPTPQKPIFGNNRVEVTRKAADIIADVFRQIVARGEDRTRAQRFILQLLVSVVAEDLGLLPGEIVTTLLAEIVGGKRAVASPDHGTDAHHGIDDAMPSTADATVPSSYDLLGGLFRQMATAEPARGGRYAGVDYFNGGLFAIVDPIELRHAEAYALHHAALTHDWAQVKPEIFGTLFQHSMDAKARHALGAHFTSEFDIQKVVGPTIVRPWRERIEAAGKSIGKLREVLAALRRFRVLDPACGSGNFLFVAYREIKRLEREILRRLRELSKKEPLESAISLKNFYGIDLDPFAVELAKVTLMLAKELELIEAKKLVQSDQLLIEEKALPLDNLDANILCADALFTAWPPADAIAGNPPYLGSRYLAKEHGYDYANKLYARFPGVPKMADFCTHWFRLAHDALPPGGRAGLVGTNTIRQNESREASLDYIVENGGVITEAISSQVWSGDAAVHVSIVNWEKAPAATLGGALGPSAVSGGPPEIPECAPAPADASSGDAAGEAASSPPFRRAAEKSTRAECSTRSPRTCRLTFQRGDSVDSPWETYELPVINPALSVGTDVTGAQVLVANQEPKVVFVGQYPFHEGFLLTPDEATQMIKADQRNREVLFPYMIGRDLVEEGGPTRWSIDFGQNDVFFARGYPLAFERVKERVMPDVIAHAEAEKAKTGKATTRWTRVAERWWQFRDYQPGTIAAIKTVPRYIAVSRVTKRPIFEFVSSGIRPDNTLVVFPFADDYSFGILSSGLHFAWFKARCSSLKGDFRYTSDTVFGTFPWPQLEVEGIAPSMPRRAAGSDHGSDGALPSSRLAADARAKIAEVAAAAVALRALRREIMAKLGYSLRALYRTLDTPGANPLRDAHTRLDTAVRAAYAMPKDADPLAFLRALNLTLAAKEKAGQPITPPGLHLTETEYLNFVTKDCVHVSTNA